MPNNKFGFEKTEFNIKPKTEEQIKNQILEKTKNLEEVEKKEEFLTKKILNKKTNKEVGGVIIRTSLYLPEELSKKIKLASINQKKRPNNIIVELLSKYL